jgi:hypothetical protein
VLFVGRQEAKTMHGWLKVYARKRRLLILYFVLIVFSGLNAIPSRGNAKSLFVGLGVMSLLSLIVRAGWTPALTILGAYIGLLLDSGPKSGPKDAQILDTAITIMATALTGLACGLLVEFVAQVRSVSEHEKSQETPDLVLRQQKLTTDQTECPGPADVANQRSGRESPAE